MYKSATDEVTRRTAAHVAAGMSKAAARERAVLETGRHIRQMISSGNVLEDLRQATLRARAKVPGIGTTVEAGQFFIVRYDAKWRREVLAGPLHILAAIERLRALDD